MMTMYKKLIVGLGLSLLISLQCGAESHDTTPTDVIEKLHEQLIENMQAGDQISYDDRYAKLDPLIRESFDFPTIARVVLGKHWKKLDESKRTEFIETFTQLSIANYASQFNSYSKEQFTTLGDEEKKKGRILVLTQLQTTDRTIPFNYLLQPVADSWRIINVVVDGVSDLSLKRSDYGTILKNEGFSELVKKLQEKIEFSKNPPVE